MGTDCRSQTAQPVPNSCIDHRSPITEETQVYAFYVPDCRGIIDHRSSITNRSTGSKQLYRSPITDHRGNTSLRILCTRLPWNHRSPIIDHKPLNRFQTVEDQPFNRFQTVEDQPLNRFQTVDNY